MLSRDSTSPPFLSRVYPADGSLGLLPNRSDNVRSRGVIGLGSVTSVSFLALPKGLRPVTNLFLRKEETGTPQGHPEPHQDHGNGASFKQDPARTYFMHNSFLSSGCMHFRYSWIFAWVPAPVCQEEGGKLAYQPVPPISTHQRRFLSVLHGRAGATGHTPLAGEPVTSGV